MYVLPVGRSYIGDTALDNAMFCSANRLGAYFSKERIRDSSASVPPLDAFPFAFDNWNITPQVSIPQNSFITDTSQYTRIEGVFRAEGGEEYLTIGNFYPLSQTLCRNFYSGQVFSDTSSDPSKMWNGIWFVDSLQLQQVAPPDSLVFSGTDTSICQGDSLLISAIAEGADTAYWNDGDTALQRYFTQPGTYWLQASYSCGYSLYDTLVLHERDPLPPPPAISDTTICEGENLVYTLPPGPQYFLNGTVLSSALQITAPGSYALTRKTTCEEDTVNFEVSQKVVDEVPVGYALSDTSLCDLEEMLLKLPSGDFKFSLNGTAFQVAPIISDQGNYTLEIDNGCERYFYHFAVTDERCLYKLFIPNAFTPNSDGRNDVFKVQALNFDSFHLKIFNRWGQEIFTSNSPEVSWNGSYKGEVVQGSFVYHISLTSNGRTVVKTGSVSVLR